ncbi:MAG TPA: NADH-quinone oxidoreductase subunit M [Acidimicrobiales bacterium]|nr:NADH-quinone oxidoreductase subunit M [Acidimicrobiales bacterium]
MLGTLLASEAGNGAPSFDILTTLVALPAVGAAVVALVPRSRAEVHRPVALAFTAATVAMAVWLMVAFEAGDGGYQFVVDRTWVSDFGVSWHVGVDGISLFLVVLTAVLFPVALLGAVPQHDAKAYYAWLLLLEAGCLGVFVARDLFMFFVMFEIVLVPMYFLIGGWGYANRVYAALKFFLFTMFGSSLMLVGIVATAYVHRDAVEDANRAEAQEILARADGEPSRAEATRVERLEADQPLSFDLEEIADARTVVDDSSSANPLDWSAARWIFLAFALAFAIKVPLFPVHTWLPDAHTEAPTAGSVILAGVMLKLGTYGLLRLGVYLFPDAANFFAPGLVTLGVVGIIYGAIVATMQKDLKRLVAYSSVAHLGFIVLGTFALTTQGIQGGLLQNVNHGLSTGALFLLVGMISDRRHTREIAALRGLQKVAPVFAAVFTVVMLSSIGLPGLNGFVGEFLILIGSFLTRRWWAVVAAAGVILAAVYLLWAYQRVFHGEVDGENERFAELTWREGAVLAPLLGLIVFLGVYPKPVLDRMEPAVDRLVAHVDENSDFVSPDIGGSRERERAAADDDRAARHGDHGDEAGEDAADDEHAEAQP